MNMDSKEQIYNTADGAASDGRLKDLLTEAYPDPKGKIALSVMAQIRAEREAEEKRIRSEKAAAMRRRQGLFMKWGGMAACMMILCGALVIAAPLMNRTDSTSEAGTAQVQVLADDAAVAAGSSADALYTDTFTYTAEEEVTEEAAMTKCAPLKKTAGVENYAADVENYAADADNGAAPENRVYGVMAMAADAAVEEDHETQIEREAFLQSLLDGGLLTPAQYESWMASKGYENPGDWTIEELCEAFDVAYE